MKKQSYRFFTGFCAAAMMLGSTFPAFAWWEKDQNGWYYADTAGRKTYAAFQSMPEYKPEYEAYDFVSDNGGDLVSRVVAQEAKNIKEFQGYNNTVEDNFNAGLVYAFRNDGHVDIVMKRSDDGILNVYRTALNGTGTMKFQIAKELDQAGAVAADENGNMYVLFGRLSPANVVDGEVYRLVKYNSNWERIAQISLSREQTDSHSVLHSGTRMRVSDGIVCIADGKDFESARLENSYYGVSSDLRHQGSTYLLIDAESMRVIMCNDFGNSHSLSRDVLYADGKFYIADMGDTNETRGFNITSYNRSGSELGKRTLFLFKNNIYREPGKDDAFYRDDGHFLVNVTTESNNNTYAHMGNLVHTDSGNYFVGTYENKNETQELGARNVFVQAVDRDDSPHYLTDYEYVSQGGSNLLLEAGELCAFDAKNGKVGILYERCRYENGIDGDVFREYSGYQTFHDSIVWRFDRRSLHYLEYDPTTGQTEEKKAMSGYFEKSPLPNGADVYYDAAAGKAYWISIYQNTIRLNVFNLR